MSDGLPHRLVDILLIDDSEADVDMTRRTFERGRIANPLVVLRDGEQAIDYLRRAEPFQSASRPGLVLLDLSLPKLDGRELVEAIRADPCVHDIAVIALTASRTETELCISAGLQADGYFEKPVKLENLVQAIQRLQSLWIGILNIPQQP